MEHSPGSDFISQKRRARRRRSTRFGARDMRIASKKKKGNRSCPERKCSCSGIGLRILNREFRAVGSGTDWAVQRVYRTPSVLEYTNLFVKALVLGTLEPERSHRRIEIIVAERFEKIRRIPKHGRARRRSLPHRVGKGRRSPSPTRPYRRS